SSRRSVSFKTWGDVLLRSLPPGDRYGGRSAVQIAPLVLGTIFEPGDQPSELLDSLLIRLPAFFGGSQLGVAEHAGSCVAAGPRDMGCWGGSEQGDPVEWAVLLVETDHAALDLVLADVVAVQVKVE